MLRVTNGFALMGLAQFSQILNVIVTSMTGNPHFTTLQPAVEALSIEATNYHALVAKAASRDKDAILARDANRKKLIGMLHTLGFNVSAIANGNAEILSLSGFPYTQPKKPTPPLQKPAVPKLVSGVNNGEINCKATGQRGMKSVKYYITSDVAALTAGDDTGWNVISYNEIKYTFSDLIPGQRYYVKVGLVGVRGQEVISDAISYIAQ